VVGDLGAPDDRIAFMTARSVAAWTVAAGVLLLPVDAAGGSGTSQQYRTSRAFRLDAGRAVRTFTFKEHSGVILLNRLTVPQGVRASVDARIPGVAGARVASWQRRGAPALSCQRRGAVDVCVQGEEWCPMPQATWHFRLVKLGGPPGWIRFDYVVAPPPSGR
jgi:hypothetical protein